MKYLNQLKKENLDGKKILLRVDFDVPVDGDKIGENFRVRAQEETINYLAESNAKVVLAAHISAIKSFLPITEQLSEVIGQTLTLVPHSELAAAGNLFDKCQFLLLDNLRQDPREEKNDAGFAEFLSQGFDYYINNDFAVCHRRHSSVSAITKYLPSYAGFLVKKEVETLTRVLEAPAEGKILVLGGAKISTKLPVIKNFLDKAEKILVGGALANNFFKAQGIDVGSSLVDDSVPPNIMSSQDMNLVLPEDVLISKDRTGQSEAESHLIKDLDKEYLIVDIGPETAKRFAEVIKKSKMVIWNGPMGLSEVEKFAGGTKTVANAVAQTGYSIIGGGDTITAADKLDLLGKFGYISTGGGAMLAFLAGERLPGLEALSYYDD